MTPVVIKQPKITHKCRAYLNWVTKYEVWKCWVEFGVRKEVETDKNTWSSHARTLGREHNLPVPFAVQVKDKASWPTKLINNNAGLPAKSTSGLDSIQVTVNAFFPARAALRDHCLLQPPLKIFVAPCSLYTTARTRTTGVTVSFLLEVTISSHARSCWALQKKKGHQRQRRHNNRNSVRSVDHELLRVIRRETRTRNSHISASGKNKHEKRYCNVLSCSIKLYRRRLTICFSLMPCVVDCSYRDPCCVDWKKGMQSLNFSIVPLYTELCFSKKMLVYYLSPALQRGKITTKRSSGHTRVPTTLNTEQLKSRDLLCKKE